MKAAVGAHNGTRTVGTGERHGLGRADAYYHRPIDTGEHGSSVLVDHHVAALDLPRGDSVRSAKRADRSTVNIGDVLWNTLAPTSASPSCERGANAYSLGHADEWRRRGIQG